MKVFSSILCCLIAIFICLQSTSLQAQAPFKKQASTQFTTSLTGGKPAVFDYNNDGIKDVILANLFFPLMEGSFVIYFGQENGTFVKGLRSPTVMTSELLLTSRVAGGYYNNDSNADVAMIMNDTSMWVCFGNGDGTFQDPKIALLPIKKNYALDIPQVNYFESFDIDQDNRDEIILFRGMYDFTSGWKSDGLRVLDFSEKSWWTTKEHTPIRSIEDLALGDFNNDKKFDIAIIDDGFNGLSLWNSNIYNGSHKHTRAYLFPSFKKPRTLAAGDLNDDGFDEVVVGNIKGPIGIIDVSVTNYWFEATQLTEVSAEDIVFDMKVFDVDQDGMKDIVAFGTDNTNSKTNLYYYRRNGKFSFDKPIIQKIPYRYVDPDNYARTFASWCDINENGSLDFVLNDNVSSNATIQLLTYLDTNPFKHGLRKLTAAGIDNNVKIRTYGGAPYLRNDLLKIEVAGLSSNAIAIMMWARLKLPTPMTLYGIPNFITLIPPMKLFPAKANSNGKVIFDLPVPDERDLYSTKHYFEFVISDGNRLYTSPAIEMVLWKKFLK